MYILYCVHDGYAMLCACYICSVVYIGCYLHMVLCSCCICGAMYIWCCVHDCTSGDVSM